MHHILMPLLVPLDVDGLALSTSCICSIVQLLNRSPGRDQVQGVLMSAAERWPHIHISDSLVMADRAVAMAEAGCKAVCVLGVDFMSENVRAILDEAGHRDVQVPSAFLSPRIASSGLCYVASFILSCSHALIVCQADLDHQIGHTPAECPFMSTPILLKT